MGVPSSGLNNLKLGRVFDDKSNWSWR
jgi:hypothetical protein